MELVSVTEVTTCQVSNGRMVSVPELMGLQQSCMVIVPEVTGLQWSCNVSVPEVTGLQWSCMVSVPEVTRNPVELYGQCF